MTNQEFVKKYAPAMVECCTGTKLFPSVMLAQALLEGAAGKSALAKKHHNHFGIKAGSTWKGLTYFVSTGEQTKTGTKYMVKDYFRSYPSDYEGFKDRNRLLHTKNYERVLAAKTPEDQCKALQICRYATDINYANKLISILNSPLYNLKQYDQKKK